MALSSRGRDAHSPGRLLNTKTGEVAQLDQACFDWIFAFELAKGLVERQEIIEGLIGSGLENVSVEFDTLPLGRGCPVPCRVQLHKWRNQWLTRIRGLRGCHG